MRKSAAAIVLVLVFAWSRTSEAAVTLFDYVYNIDGAISNINDLGDPLPTQADDTGFDSTTGFGSIDVAITSPGAHYVGLFLDHEIDEVLNGFSNEFGATSGVAAAGQTWEIDEPGFLFGDIFDNFLASALDNLNGVPSGLEDDPAMALAWEFALAAGQTADISFTVAETPPAGFFLSQTDPDTDVTIYFSSTLAIRGGPPVVPEPTSVAIWSLLGIVGTGFRRIRRGLR